MEKLKAKYMISQIGPRLICLVLENIRMNKAFSRDEIALKLEKTGKLQVRDPILLNELFDILVGFRIIDVGPDKTFELNTNGNCLKAIYLRNKSLFFEIYHLMQYHAFDITLDKIKNLPFKSYQILVQLLYQGSKKSNKQLADEIDTNMKKQFNVEGSFSDACVTRGLQWLYELQPAVVDQVTKQICKRESVLPQVLMFCISNYYRKLSINLRDPIFIDMKTEKELCTPIFLDEKYFGHMLDSICRLYPNYIEKKYNISGTFVILKKELTFNELK